MNEPSARQIRKFNPGTLQSDAEVKRQFVVREREFGLVMEVLGGNIGSASCQHVLLVAPRGRGKTMLLARAAAELRTNEGLSERLFPVRFMEENPEIFDASDFWLEALFHLARELAARDAGLARELREAHGALAARPRGDFLLEERARAAVLETADRLGKQLVLMVENLQALCADADDDFGWKLRKELQTEPRVMLLATAAGRFKGLDDAREPFFELFRVVDLEPLDTESCRRLWKMAAGGDVDGREIRPLEILTGGSPRLLTILAGFARRRSMRELLEQLVQLVDEHTEYFRGVLEAFAKTERRVYLSVVDLWRPSSVGEIAARARLDIRVVSTMLGRLAGRGAVIAEGKGGKRLYAAAERLYSIYYKLRRERGEAAVVQHLIRFMTVFYSRGELAGMSGMLHEEAAQRPSIREGIERAMVEDPHIRGVLRGMGWPEPEGAAGRGAEFSGGTALEEVKRLAAQGLEHAQSGEMEAAIAAWDEVVERFGNSHAPEVQDWVAAALYDKGRLQGKSGDAEAAIATCNEVVKRFGGNDAPDIRYWVAAALCWKANQQGKLGEAGAAITTCNEVVGRFENSDALETQGWVAAALCWKANQQEELSETEAAIATYDEVVKRFGGSDAPDTRYWVAVALCEKGERQGESGDAEAAIATCDEVVKRFGDSDAPNIQFIVSMSLCWKGNQQEELSETEAAIATYDEVVKRYGGSDAPDTQFWAVLALCRKGNRQRESGETEAAIATYDEVVGRYGSSDAPEIRYWVAAALCEKGNQQGESGRTEAAIATYDEVVERYGCVAASSIQYWATKALLKANCLRAWALLMLGRHGASLDAFRSAYAAFDPENKEAVREMLQFLPGFVASGASGRDIAEILSSDEAKSAALGPLIVALRRHGGEDVRAPAEISDVAQDILKDIDERIEDKKEKSVRAAS